ncbi:MAG: rhamnulokinase family protein [Pirellulaceae bacterium]
MQQVYLGVDIGGSSGRVVGGTFDGSVIALEEVHRFGNAGVQVGPYLMWDTPRQWSDVKDGLRAAVSKYGDSIVSIGVDTWGVDFGLLGANDQLLSLPMHYRDPYLDGILEHAFSIRSKEEIFAETGLQFMRINSLFQLLALKREKSPVLDIAEHFLMIPDIFNWLLTGEKVNEQTNATTTQFYNPKTGNWAPGVLESFDLPTHFLGPITAAGTSLGKVRASVGDDIGYGNINVVLPGTHDTASAVMAVPSTEQITDRPTSCYISSGTWSLMGAEVANPIVTQECMEMNFTNEGGVGGTTRLLKNIVGLWLVQDCRRSWQREGTDYSWDQLVEMASAAEPLRSVIDPDSDAFVAPSHMPDAISEFCKQSGQPVPESPGQIIRTALESLALRYEMVLGMLETLTGSTIELIHIVGGGTQNKLLCQLTADACSRRVLAGPVEATAIGNIMMQLVAEGAVSSIQEAREIIANSFPLDAYEPTSAVDWSDAIGTFRSLLSAP